MIAARDLHLVVVTPEKTLLDLPVRSLRFPLFDGQIGVLPGRAPLVGRLGSGELKFELVGGTTDRYYVEEGFVQIKEGTVTLLTNRAIAVASVDVEQAQKELDAAVASTPDGAVEKQVRAKVIDRNRKLIQLRSQKISERA
ncbi:MAG TPA: F0F1 ATP synthase subunit epsilon [Planctomicrobium sp.]|nr:F0F1 ATP synthase subunit epsilon [Planctomicrobium sp.]